MISVCVPVYRVHPAPNVAALDAQLAGALDGEEGELVIALNGVEERYLGVSGEARTVDLQANRGVGPGWNAAARAARGDVLVFCNDDVTLGSRSLARLAHALKSDPGHMVVGPVGSNWDLVEGRHSEWVRPDPRSPQRRECDVVSGFLFACQRQTWEELGGFDEFYAPASWEEVDFCTAVRAAGGHCYAVADVAYEHEWGVSRPQPPWARARWDGRSETWRSIHRRNRRHFLEKWAEDPVALASASAARS